MKVVTLARKPISGSVADSVAEWGTGSLNIDGTRIGTFVSTTPSGFDRYNAALAEQGYRPGKYQKGKPPLPATQGRWPANLILQHKVGCRQVGTKSAPGYTINRWTDGAKPFGGGAGHEYESEQQPDESVAVWECVDGCAVGALGAQSGVLKTGDFKQRGQSAGTEQLGGWKTGARTHKDFTGDTGTAARYFQQIQETNMQELPQELVDYLETMITPPNGEVLVALDMDEVAWETFADNQLHGFIGQGDPSPHMEEIWRTLRPGAFVAMIAPDTEPTGHTGACALEDQGFEIRDAILVVQEPGRIHYVAKCSTAERNAGIVPFERKVKEMRLFPKKDPDIIEEIEAAFAEDKTQLELLAWGEGGATRAEIPKECRHWFDEVEVETIKKKQNDHPTVKAKDVMRRLIGDLPKGSLVVDPFMGSGSTGIACIEAQQNFTGIELEMPSLQIAEARAKHWDNAELRSFDTEITSEAKQAKRKKRSFLSLRKEK